MAKIVSAEEYLSLPRSPETWLVEPVLPTSGAGLLYGDPKVGKSFAALQLAGCLTRGEDWLGFRCPKPAVVVYVQLDTPRSLWADRLEKLRGSMEGGSVAGQCNSPSNAPPSNFPCVSIPPVSPPPWEKVLFADRETLDTWPFDILNDDHRSTLKAALDPIQADLVIIDTLREAAYGHDENNSTAMQMVIAQLTAAVKPAALLVVSHSRKPNVESGPDLMNDNRGSNYIIGKMDSIMRFSHSTVRISGRSIDEQSIGIVRADNGFWDLAVDPLEKQAVDLLKSGLSMREMARILHDGSNKSESASRAYLRRLQEKQK